MKYYFVYMIQYFISYFKYLINRFFNNKEYDLFEYRKHLFNELNEKYPKKFDNKRILEIGPRDGLDTYRLEKLNPNEIVIMDLPNRTEENLKWMKDLNVNHEYIEANFMYMSEEDYKKLGNFDLIWFTGVIYHNPEQLRFLFKLYQHLNSDGILVLESSTIRSMFLRNKNLVQIFYPDTYRDTQTISHLPSKLAIKSWLGMVGFNKITDSQCFNYENINLKNKRYACFAEKDIKEEGKSYYSKQFGEDAYLIGGSS